MACSLFRPKRTFAWHVILESETPSSDSEGVIKRTISIIEQRLDAAGIHNFEVVALGSSPSRQILVNLPEVPDRTRLVQLITTMGQLELTAIVSPPSPAPVLTFNTREEAVAQLGKVGRENRDVLPYSEREGPETGPQESKPSGKWVVVERPPIIDGSELRNAEAIASRRNDQEYQISFSLRPEGAERFGVWTGSHIDEYLGVVLNGEVKSIAFIKSRISDQGVISGRFTKQSAEDLALILRSGALPAPVKIIEQGSNK